MMKRYEAPQKGLDASNKLFTHYKELLQLLGIFYLCIH